MCVSNKWLLSLFHTLVFLTHIPCDAWSLIWSYRQCSYCGEALLILPESSGITSPCLFSWYIAGLPLYWLHIYLDGFLPLLPPFTLDHWWSFRRPIWEPMDLVSPAVMTTAPCTELVSVEPPVHSSCVPLHSKITIISWQKVWCHHLFLPSSSVYYWSLERPLATVFSSAPYIIHST